MSDVAFLFLIVMNVWWGVTAETQVTFVLSNYYLASNRKIIIDIATAT